MFGWLFNRKRKEEKIVLPKGVPSNYPPAGTKTVSPQGGSGTAPAKVVECHTHTVSSPPVDNTLNNMLLYHMITSPPIVTPPSYDPPSSSSSDSSSSSSSSDTGSSYSSGSGDFSGDTGSGGSCGGDF